LADLLTETGHAHHKAFLATDGEDPEWPLWYAEYLEPRIVPHLGMQPTRSRLVQCLLNADERHAASEAAEPWSRFYANYLLNLNADDMSMTESPEGA
jgi:hypothetical protein